MNDTNINCINSCLNGNCQGNICVCYSPYTGPNCSIRFEIYIGLPYVIYYWISVVLQIILVGYSFYKLFLIIKNSKKFSMQHLVLILIFSSVTLRLGNYFTDIDGDYIRNFEYPVWQQLSWDFFYPCIISSYTCELFIWIELYTATSFQKIEMLPKLKWVFLVVNLIIFPIQLTYDLLSSLTSISVMLIIWYGYLGIVILAEVIGFFFVGGRLLHKMKKMSSVTPLTKKIFFKLSILTFVIGGVALLALILDLVFVFLAFYDNIWIWFCSDCVLRIVEFFLPLLLAINIRPPIEKTVSYGSEDIELKVENSKKSLYSFSESD